MYRSQPRFRQLFDWDLQRQRYNQFVRMLNTKGGWEVQPIEKLNYFYKIPFRATKELLENSIYNVENSLKSSRYLLVRDTYGKVDDFSREFQSDAMKVYNGLYQYLAPYIQPIVTTVDDIYESFRYDPRVASALQILKNLESEISTVAGSIEEKSINSEYLNNVIER